MCLWIGWKVMFGNDKLLHQHVPVIPALAGGKAENAPSQAFTDHNAT